MQQEIMEVRSQSVLARDVYELTLSGDTAAITAPGQFLNIRLEGFYLRRPISVCDWDDSSVTLIYKTVGAGTKKLAQAKPGDKLDVLSGLGNGFDTALCGKTPLLIGGGVGTPPMFGLCKRLLAGVNPTVILGFASEADVFYEDKFRALGADVRIATADGSRGICGFVTDAMKNIPCSYFYACGPEPMLHAVYDQCAADGQLSFEERMGCGFGACMGCTCQTKYGAKRICRDGPVLKKEEIVW